MSYQMKNWLPLDLISISIKELYLVPTFLRLNRLSENTGQLLDRFQLVNVYIILHSEFTKE
jgi:hypothetical protein